MRGRMIVVEGLDGVGKTVLSRRLADALGAVWLTTPPAELRPLRGPFDRFLSDRPAASQLFYAAMVLAVGQEADALRARGRDVVIDRYWATTRAYGLVRGSPLDLVEVEALIPAADLTVLVDLAEPTRRDRLRAREVSALDRETLDPEIAAALRRALRAQLLGRVSGRPILIDISGLDEGAAAREALARVNAPPEPRLFLTG